MKRHPALIPLSRDHHDGLVQAVRLRRAAADGDASARLAAAREFVEFFRNDERVHLRDEEEELFPLFLRHVQSQPAPLREARVQHMQLEGFARKLDIAVAARPLLLRLLSYPGSHLQSRREADLDRTNDGGRREVRRNRASRNSLLQRLPNLRDDELVQSQFRCDGVCQCPARASCQANP